MRDCHLNPDRTVEYPSSDTARGKPNLYVQGSVRSIGVSNFGVAHLQKLLRTANVVPAVNQVGLSPFQPRSRLVNLCRSKGIVLLVSLPAFIFFNNKIPIMCFAREDVVP